LFDDAATKDEAARASIRIKLDTNSEMMEFEVVMN
jgi:hypothetical protein